MLVSTRSSTAKNRRTPPQRADPVGDKPGRRVRFEDDVSPSDVKEEQHNEEENKKNNTRKKKIMQEEQQKEEENKKNNTRKKKIVIWI